MPSNSRPKSHKQSKHTSSEYDYVNKNGEKRKNEKVSEDFSTSVKRRRDKVCVGGDEGEVVNVAEMDLKLRRSEKSVEKECGRSNVDGAVLRKEGVNESSRRGRERTAQNESGRNKVHDGKYETAVLRKEVVNESSKRGTERDVCPTENEMRNIESEKELEKRAKRREVYNNEDIKQKDTEYNSKENGGRVSKSRDVKDRGESEKDNKHKSDKKREDYERDRNHEDKYREDSNRDYKQKEERYKEDVDQDHGHKTGRSRDDTDRKKRSRDHPSELETKNLKDVSHRQTSNRDRSPVYDDRVSRHKDNKEKRRDNDKDEIDYRSRSTKDQHPESKRPRNDVKIDRNSERGRSSSRNDDIEITGNHSRHRSPPNDKYYPSRDHYRVSNQEDRGHQNVNSSGDVSNKISSRSLEKISQKDDNSTDDLPIKKRPRSDIRSSTISPSSKSNEHRDLSRHDVRRNLDVKESGQHRHDSPSFFGSSENDRGKINNHNWRSGEPNMGIWPNGQSNWNNFPNWPSPLPVGGFMPFHHIPPPIFNPAMQQFMPSMFGRPPMNLNHAGMPYHVPVGRPPMNMNHGWEANNGVFADGSHAYGNWGHGTTQMNNQIWESSADVQPAAQKNDNSALIHTDEILPGQTSQPIKNEQSQPELVTPEDKKATESSHISIVEKDEGTLISRAYLSKIDISKDLTRPELYEQCRNILDLDQESVSDESDCKILFLEEGLEGDSSNAASLFDAVDDSVFKKAMSLYTKHRVDFTAMNKEGESNSTRSVSAPERDESFPVDDVTMAEEALEGPDLEVSKENDDLPVQKEEALKEPDLEVSKENDDPPVKKEEVLEGPDLEVSKENDDPPVEKEEVLEGQDLEVSKENDPPVEKEEVLEGPDMEVSKENDVPQVQKLDTDPMNEDTVNDEPLPTSDKMEMDVEHPVANKAKESSAASGDGCEVEVKDSCNDDDGSKEVEKPSSDGDGSLLALTNVSTSDLIECGSVNLSRIQS